VTNVADFFTSDAGPIPIGWDASTVGAEFDVRLGKMLDAARNAGEPKPYLGNRSVQWGRIDVNDLGMVPLTRAEQLALRLRSGDLLVCEGGEVGRAAIWRDQLPECYYQKALHRLRPRSGYSPELMAAYLRLWSDRGALADYVTQTSIAHLPREKLITVPLPRPPATEQRAITAALSDVDALLAKLDQLIAKKRDLKQAAMQQLLTGRSRLSGFSEPWGERALQSVVARLEAGVSVRSVEGDAGGSDCFVLKTSAVADGNFDASERKPVIPADRGRVRCPVRAGTILVSRMNTPDLVGEVGFVDRDHPNSFLPDRLWAASVPKGAVSARWLSYVLSSSEYKQRLRDVATGTSGSMKNISKGAFLGISVKVPTLDEQRAIAQVLSDMDAELVALEARSDKTRQLKQGMMQALLTGRIRLV